MSATNAVVDVVDIKPVSGETSRQVFFTPYCISNPRGSVQVSTDFCRLLDYSMHIKFKLMFTCLNGILKDCFVNMEFQLTLSLCKFAVFVPLHPDSC